MQDPVPGLFSSSLPISTSPLTPLKIDLKSARTAVELQRPLRFRQLLRAPATMHPSNTATLSLPVHLPSKVDDEPKRLVLSNVLLQVVST